MLHRIGFIIVASAITFWGIRGTGRIPLDTADALKYATPENMHAVLNTPFTIIKSFEKNTSTPFVLEYFSTITEPGYLYVPETKPTEPVKKNIVVVILESFSKEYTSLSDPMNSFTPFLDSLMKHSLVFSNCYANGLKSIDGIPAILSSLPAYLDDPIINSHFNYVSVHSFATLLKKWGYTSVFMHGGFNGTMNFDAYAISAGYDKYLGKNEYPNPDDFDGSWGIWDEPYLNYAGKVMDTLQRPFHVALFTLSSHHPFNIPEQYIHKFKEGPYENLKSIQYTDYALRLFFEKNKNKSWFQNSIFVLTADHTSLSGHPFYITPAGLHSIPLLIYDPSKKNSETYKKTAQQIDILPTVMDYVGYPFAFYSMGNSLLRPSVNEHAVFYYSDGYYLVKDSLMCRWNKLNKKFEFLKLNNEPISTLTLHQEKEMSEELLEHLKRFSSLLRSGGSRHYTKTPNQIQGKSPSGKE